MVVRINYEELKQRQEIINQKKELKRLKELTRENIIEEKVDALDRKIRTLPDVYPKPIRILWFSCCPVCKHPLKYSRLDSFRIFEYWVCHNCSYEYGLKWKTQTTIGNGTWV